MRKLWFDDSEARGCPNGWTWAKDVEEAIEIFKFGDVVECSLDHDIETPNYNGYSEPTPLTGADLCMWMANNLPPAKWPHTIRIHSRNMGGGVERMKSILRDFKPSFTEVIVKMFEPGMTDELSEKISAKSIIEHAKTSGQDSFGLANDSEMVEILSETVKKV